MVSMRGRALGLIAAAAFLLLPLPALAQCGPMDVVFVVDNTGSMTDVINQVQSQVTAIANGVVQASGGDYQLGLVTCPQNNVQIVTNMAPKNIQDFTTGVGTMVTSSSCDEPAATDAGLDAVVNQLTAANNTGPDGKQIGDFTGKFRASAAKVIIVITDARPSGFNCSYVAGRDDVHAHTVATQAAQKDMHIAAVFVPTLSAEQYGFIPTVIQIMQDYAVTTGGEFFQTQPDASDLAKVIDQIISTCGGAATLGNNSLVLNPTEVVLRNGDSADIALTNFTPAPTGETTVYAASGLPSDSTVTFSDRTPDIDLTEAKNIHITIGPDTLAGTYIMAVTATQSTGVANNYVLVHVDCTPPFLLGTADLNSQSQTVTSGSSATLSVSPTGNVPFKYQWYAGHSGSTASPLTGQTGSQLKTGAITVPSEFWVRITNACGSLDSATATVTPR